MRPKIFLNTMMIYGFFTGLTQASNALSFTLSSSVEKGRVIIRATPPTQHHFNVKAPMVLEDMGSRKRHQPRHAKSSQVEFSLPKADTKAVSVTLYLCDDANTHCEKHTVVYELNRSGSTISPQPIPAKLKQDRNGFILNDPSTAFFLAKQDNKPLLLDFYGIWCPPCNQLDEEVFSSPSFKGALDADAPISWDLKSKYKLRVIGLLAKVHQALGKPQKGLQLLRNTIENTKISKQLDIRTHRYLKDLKELEAKLSSNNETPKISSKNF